MTYGFTQLEKHRWQEPPRKLRIGPGIVHLWRASILQWASELNSFWRLLSYDEKLRAEKINVDRRNYFIISRAILRLILSRYLQTEASKILFSYGKYKKPALSEEFKEYNLKFNLAHSGDLSVYAISFSDEVGIDLERIHNVNEAEYISNRFFTKEEKAFLIKFSGHDRQLAFFRIWTRKEADAKGKGVGLAGIPDKRRVSSPKLKQWTFRALRPAAGYVVTLAVPNRIEKLCCWNWSK